MKTLLESYGVNVNKVFVVEVCSITRVHDYEFENVRVSM